MRCLLDLPSYLVRDACLYAPGRSELDAVCHVLADYPRLVSEVRDLRRRLDGIDRESAQLDELIEQLQGICRQILDL